MRSAILTDCHANLSGLEAALTAIEQEDCDALDRTAPSVASAPTQPDVFVSSSIAPTLD